MKKIISILCITLLSGCASMTEHMKVNLDADNRYKRLETQCENCLFRTHDAGYALSEAGWGSSKNFKVYDFLGQELLGNSDSFESYQSEYEFVGEITDKKLQLTYKGISYNFNLPSEINDRIAGKSTVVGAEIDESGNVFIVINAKDSPHVVWGKMFILEGNTNSQSLSIFATEGEYSETSIAGDVFRFVMRSDTFFNKYSVNFTDDFVVIGVSLTQTKYGKGSDTSASSYDRDSYMFMYDRSSKERIAQWRPEKNQEDAFYTQDSKGRYIKNDIKVTGWDFGSATLAGNKYLIVGTKAINIFTREEVKLPNERLIEGANSECIYYWNLVDGLFDGRQFFCFDPSQLQ